MDEAEKASLEDELCKPYFDTLTGINASNTECVLQESSNSNTTSDRKRFFGGGFWSIILAVISNAVDQSNSNDSSPTDIATSLNNQISNLVVNIVSAVLGAISVDGGSACAGMSICIFI